VSGLPELVRHWRAVTLGGRRLVHGFAPREAPAKGWRSLCRRIPVDVLTRLEEGRGEPLCADCQIEGERRLAIWLERAGVTSNTPQASPYSNPDLASPDDDDPYA
jgi:hypothetical protein